MNVRIDIPRDLLREFCQRRRIRRLSLFGSVLRNDFRPESDIDILVEFEPEARVGLIGLAGMEIELGAFLGRQVELHTPAGLNPQYRDEVLTQTEILYER